MANHQCKEHRFERDSSVWQLRSNINSPEQALSENSQRRMGEHKTSRALIQPLWNPSSRLVVPMAIRQGATKASLLCFLAGNSPCCVSFQMSFTCWIEKSTHSIALVHFGSALGVWSPLVMKVFMFDPFLWMHKMVVQMILQFLFTVITHLECHSHLIIF